MSIDSIKKRLREQRRLYSTGGSGSGGGGSLAEHFTERWGAKRATRKAARRRFTESLAAYSVVNYLLAVRDRHNGNILIDDEGGVVHIDFGFFLSNSPGGNINFEVHYGHLKLALLAGLRFQTNSHGHLQRTPRPIQWSWPANDCSHWVCVSIQGAPFKLTREMIDVMGGEHSLEFATFRELTVRGFRAAQSLLPKIQLLVQMALEAHGGSFPCFSGGAAAVMDGLQQVSTHARDGLSAFSCQKPLGSLWHGLFLLPATVSETESVLIVGLVSAAVPDGPDDEARGVDVRE